jgi:hypothetical protein
MASPPVHITRLAGIDSIDAAEASIGFEVCVPIDELPELGPDEVYHFQLVGLRVETDSVVLDYRNRSNHHNGGEWEPMRYAVALDWTPCGFGGKRVVFAALPDGLARLDAAVGKAGPPVAVDLEPD